MGYAEKDEFHEAIEHFNNIIKLKPVNAGAYNNLGNAKFRVNQFEEASKDFQKVLNLYRSQGKTDVYNQLLRFFKGHFPDEPFE